MTRTLRIIELGRTDVDDIFNWLVHRSARGAIAWYLAFRNTARQIASAGESYALAPESEPLHRELRQALFKTRRGRTYRIVFELMATDAIILRVRGPGQRLLRRGDLPD